MKITVPIDKVIEMLCTYLIDHKFRVKSGTGKVTYSGAYDNVDASGIEFELEDIESR